MRAELFAVIAAVVVFASGIGGLSLRAWRPRNEGVEQTRDLINRMSGLVATMAAIVLGLLIASSYSFYSNQQAALETASVRLLELDRTLGRYGPDARQARDQIKQQSTKSYVRIFGSGSGEVQWPTIEQTAASMDSMFNIINRLREAAPPERRLLLDKAAEIMTLINDQRVQMSLQPTKALSWPLMMILVAWVSLLFFGFGMLAEVNVTNVIAVAVGAIALASALFLIVEFSTPYSGLLRVSPEPIAAAIAALGK